MSFCLYDTHDLVDGEGILAVFIIHLLARTVEVVGREGNGDFALSANGKRKNGFEKGEVGLLKTAPQPPKGELVIYLFSLWI